jgi:hypothetical protein
MAAIAPQKHKTVESLNVDLSFISISPRLLRPQVIGQAEDSIARIRDPS